MMVGRHETRGCVHLECAGILGLSGSKESIKFGDHVLQKEPDAVSQESIVSWKIYVADTDGDDLRIKKSVDFEINGIDTSRNVHCD